MKLFVVRIVDRDAYVYYKEFRFPSREMLISFLDNAPDVLSFVICSEV